MPELCFLEVLAEQLKDSPKLDDKGIELPMTRIVPNLLVEIVGDHNQIEWPNGQHKTLLLVPNIRKEKQVKTHVVNKVGNILLILLLEVVIPGVWQEKVH